MQKRLTDHLGRLMSRTPMLRVALALVAGILLAEYLPHPSKLLLTLVFCTGFLLLAVFVRNRQSLCVRIFPLLLWVTLIAFGWLLSLIHAPADPFGESADGDLRNFLVRLRDTPRQTEKCFKVEAEVMSVYEQEQWMPRKGRIMLYLQKDSSAAKLQYGDLLWVNASPRLPDNREGQNHFDYRRYLRHKGILWQCYVRNDCWTPSGEAVPFSVRGYAKRTQKGMVERIQRTPLSPSQKAVAESLLLGWRDDVDDDTWQQFRNAGIAHLLCVSGLHVGIVAWLAGAALFFLGLRRWQRILKRLLQIAAIWLFVLLTGMAPSTLRAGVMFSLLLIGGMFEQRPNSLNNLCTSMAVLLLVRPMMLFDVGFQLSYAAVCGIIIWHKPLCELIPFLCQPNPKWYLWLPQKIWALACLSTSAQLATLPLVLYHFHQFPLYFLIANLTVVPFAGVLLATVMLMLATSAMPVLCGWFTRLLQMELVGVDGLTQWIGILPYATIDNIYCDLPMALMIMTALLCFTLLLCCRMRWALPAMVGCLLLMTLYLYRPLSFKQNHNQVYNQYHHTISIYRGPDGTQYKYYPDDGKEFYCQLLPFGESLDVVL